MISIDISLAIALFITISICLVFVKWIFYNYKEDIDSEDTQYLESCPHCGYVFLYFGKADVVTCPRCKYYFERLSQEQPEQ